VVVVDSEVKEIVELELVLVSVGEDVERVVLEDVDDVRLCVEVEVNGVDEDEIEFEVLVVLTDVVADVDENDDVGLVLVNVVEVVEDDDLDDDDRVNDDDVDDDDMDDV
jgi:hypothetical protein